MDIPTNKQQTIIPQSTRCQNVRFEAPIPKKPTYFFIINRVSQKSLYGGNEIFICDYYIYLPSVCCLQQLAVL